MSEALSELEILALDCQAGGASPAHGDLLELGWAVCGKAGVGRVESHWIVPRTKRRVARAVRELTGWSEDCIATAVEESQAWTALREAAQALAPGQVPTVIHFARFELAFLRDLHQRLEDGTDFPLDAICLHAIAARLFPDLPRRSIRALAGFLGHSPVLERRSAGHVDATAHIWHALVPRLEGLGLCTWPALKDWLERSPPAPRSKRRVYPLAAERRKALPDSAGVYRFLRSNGDVLYVGKAASLKRRIAGHFKGGRGPLTERALELLTQVHSIDHTETPTLLEAALLETDEIKRLDPPYNVQLRSAERCAWFASSDLCEAAPAPDQRHRIGPLPSERALLPLATLIKLCAGADPTPALRAFALAVPAAYAPNVELFTEGWRGFADEYLGGELSPARRVLQASLALWLARGRAESETAAEDAAPDEWDLARVRRRLERSLVQSGLLLRRSRWLCLLAEATVAFREPGGEQARALVVSRCVIAEQHSLASVAALAAFAPRKAQALSERRSTFDIAAYDRLRVLLSELQRIHADGGDVALRIGGRTLVAERLASLLRPV